MTKIIEWTYKLQHELDQLTHEEFNKFMENKAIRYQGKLFTVGNENETKRKNNQVKRKTSRTSKRGDSESKSV